VLTEASISGQVDHLLGLKENVIIGKLIPARAEVEVEPLPVRISEMALPAGFAGAVGRDGEQEWEAVADISDIIDEEIEGAELLEGELAGVGLEIEELPGPGGVIDGDA
jgi:hypothetical protein